VSGRELVGEPGSEESKVVEVGVVGAVLGVESPYVITSGIKKEPHGPLTAGIVDNGGGRCDVDCPVERITRSSTFESVINFTMDSSCAPGCSQI